MSRELPILFNSEMVRAILDGRKTCTRRVIKPQPQSRLCYTYAGSHKGCIGKWTYPNRGAHEFWGEEYKLPENIKDEELSKQWNPPYHTDDILYVRETWKKAPNGYYYYEDWQRNDIADITKWKPSIHMPKEAARIWLKVTDVKVERLQEITESGAKAEGIRGYTKDGNLYKYAVTDDWWIDYHNKHKEIVTGTWWQDMPRTAKDAFSYLWNSTIKKADLDLYGWNANPWVWTIEYEQCEKPEEN